MKYTKKGPCKHYDMYWGPVGTPGTTCLDYPDNEGLPCDYYMKNATREDEENGDLNRCCREREDVSEDVQTVDMFEEATNEPDRQ